MEKITKDLQYYKFCAYGFLKNLRFFDAFLLLFLMEKGISFTQIGIMYGVREIVINVFELPSGFIADIYGRKNALMFSFIAYMLSFLILFLSSSFWLFLMAFVFYGFADAFRTGTHKGMIMDYLYMHHWEDQKVNYYGHTRSFSQAGSAVSALSAGIIVFYSGSYQNIFLYSILPYVLNLALIFSYPKELNHSLKSKKHRPAFGEIVRDFFSIIRQEKVMGIMNTSALHSAYLKAVKDYIQPIMVSLIITIPLFGGLQVEKKNGLFIGIFYFLLFLLTSISSANAAKISKIKHIDVPQWSLFLGFGFGLLSGIFFQWDIWLGSILALVIIFIIENLRKPILTAYISDAVPREILSSVISTQSLWSTLLTAAIAFIFGILSDSFGLGNAFIYTSGGLIMIHALFTIWIKNREKKSA